MVCDIDPLISKGIFETLCLQQSVEKEANIYLMQAGIPE